MEQTAVVLPRSKKARKELRKTIEQKLSVSLADYRGIVGEKKFNSRIRKAARRFGTEVLRSLPVKDKKEKKQTTETSS